MDMYEQRRQEFIDSFNYELKDGLLISHDFDYEYEWAVPPEDLKFLRRIQKVNFYADCRSRDEIEEELVGRRMWVLSLYPEFFKDIPSEFLKGYGYDLSSIAVRNDPRAINLIPDEVLLSYDRECYFKLCKKAVKGDPSVLYDSEISSKEISQKFIYLSDDQISQLSIMNEMD
jgi:hypothetical protein